jgi:hypothetical protein
MHSAGNTRVCRETVKTVKEIRVRINTPLKRGVNEKGSMQSFDRTSLLSGFRPKSRQPRVASGVADNPGLEDTIPLGL